MNNSLKKNEIDLPANIMNQNAAQRVVELIAELRPNLLMEAPFIITACEVYHQRKLQKPSVMICNQCENDIFPTYGMIRNELVFCGNDCADEYWRDCQQWAEYRASGDSDHG